MFDLLLLNLRAQGIPVGLSEWLVFLTGLRKGLARTLDELYRYGRAVLVHSEAMFDQWDVAFHATFAGVELPPDISDRLQAWIREALAEGVPPGDERVPVDMTPEELR
ncbi:MAG: hypothetical protein D6798_08875, partial [Deltaproteobacteria bacterium]